MSRVSFLNGEALFLNCAFIWDFTDKYVEIPDRK